MLLHGIDSPLCIAGFNGLRYGPVADDRFCPERVAVEGTEQPYRVGYDRDQLGNYHVMGAFCDGGMEPGIVREMVKPCENVILNQMAFFPHFGEIFLRGVLYGHRDYPWFNLQADFHQILCQQELIIIVGESKRVFDFSGMAGNVGAFSSADDQDVARDQEFYSFPYCTTSYIEQCREFKLRCLSMINSEICDATCSARGVFCDLSVPKSICSIHFTSLFYANAPELFNHPMSYNWIIFYYFTIKVFFTQVN